MKKNRINKVRIISTLLLLAVMIYSAASILKPRVEGRIKQEKEIAIFDEKVKINNKINKNEEEKEAARNKSSVDVAASLLEAIGVLYVPKIDLQIIVYNSVEETALSKGVGLIPDSGDLPPKKGQNSVLTAHNGDTEQDLFINLDKLEKNDFFYIKDLSGEITKYCVEEIHVVYPEEEDNYYTHNNDESFATLRTCTPMGVNNKRLLVIGRKLPTSKTAVNITKEIMENKKFVFSKHERNMLIILIISTVMFINDFSSLLANIFLKKQKNKQNS